MSCWNLPGIKEDFLWVALHNSLTCRSQDAHDNKKHLMTYFFSTLPGIQDLNSQSGMEPMFPRMEVETFLKFIFGCTRSLLLSTSFLYLWQVGLLFTCGARLSHCSGFSCFGAQVLDLQTQLWLTRLVALRHMESSQIRDGTQAPCLGGGFPTTGP